MAEKAEKTGLRGAVVGVGYLGTFHAQKYKALMNPLGFQFVGVCDSHESQARKIGEDLGVPFFTHPEDLIGKVDFVSIATTTPAHFATAKFFLSHGVHVNVEKPITVEVSEAKELLRLAQEKNLTLAVGHSERFSPVFAALKAELKAPQFFELQRHAPFKARGAEVSVVHDLMIHDLDLLLDLDSSAVEVVSAQAGKVISDTLDWVTASFRFASGRQAFISVSRLAATMTRMIKVFEEDKIVSGNFQTGDLELGTIKAGSGSEFSYQTRSVGKGDNLLLETENFVLALQNMAELKVPGLAGVRALELAEQVIHQAQKKS
jgi:predicted dehydrogenase